MNRWLNRGDVPRGAAYDARWEALAASGASVHGEADLILSYADRVCRAAGGDDPAAPPATVLDAGCGTGRVAIELARRGLDVVGVDVDPAMLAEAQRKCPQGSWVLSDLVQLDLRRDGARRRFDVVALPGNVMIFLAPGSEGRVLAQLARHLSPTGVLIAGFQLSAERLSLPRYDEVATAAGLQLEARFATWDREPFQPGGEYAVSVHRFARSSS